VIGRPDHVHYRVRRDDGHESIFYPGGDSRIRVAAPARGLGTAAPVVELLRDARVEFEVLRHRRTTSAEGEAREAGAHDVSIRLRAADLVRLTDAAVAAVAA